MKTVKKFVLLQNLKINDKFFIKKSNGFHGYRIKKIFQENIIVESFFNETKRIMSANAEVYFFQEINEKNDRKNNF